MHAPPILDLAVVLAAGGGTRIGGPKGLLDLAGAPLARHHAAALAPFVARVVVVVGARAEAHRAALAGLDLVENPAWAVEWPIDSLARALAVAGEVSSALVTPVDTPPAAASVLRALILAPGAAVPRGPDGLDGHPVRLGPTELASVRRGVPHGGLRAVLAGAPRVPVDRPVSADFDTPEAWSRYLSERT